MPFCLWFTGIPVAGKTTLASEVINQLNDEGVPCSLIDADIIREYIYPDLGFSKHERDTNIGRLATIGSYVVRGGGNCSITAVSPYLDTRKQAIRRVGGEAYEMYVHCTKDVAAERDPTRKYWDSADNYEPSDDALFLDTLSHTCRELGSQVVAYLKDKGVIPQKGTLFIGRWSPFHRGHENIINKAREKGPVSIGVRCTPLTEGDPWTVEARIRMIKALYPNTYVFPVPDISTLSVGRTPGYNLTEQVPDPGFEKISGTEVRRLLAEKDSSWMDLIPHKVSTILQEIEDIG